MTKRSPRKTAPDAIALLKEDHRAVSALFEAYDKLGDKAHAQKLKLARKICGELKVHTQIEEEIFYPPVRAALPKQEDLLDEAEVEHDTVRNLIKTIEGMGSSDPKRKAHFTVLMEYVKHHVKEEEKEMFPKVKNLDLDLAQLGEQMKQRKTELMSEMGMEALEESEDQTA